MIRCVKLWTGADGKSHFQDGVIELEPGARGDALSAKTRVSFASFHAWPGLARFLADHQASP